MIWVSPSILRLNFSCAYPGLQGKLSLTVNSVDLAAIVEMVVENVRFAAEAKSIQIKTILDSNVGLLSGDSNRLQQVVWNLLSNSVKFTSEGGRVEVRLKQIGQQVRIVVSDSGEGIASDFLPYIFDYFRQEDGGTLRRFGGLGLGLALTRQIVEMHGGSITAESAGKSQGSKFTVMLPLINPNSESDKEK